jgi:hypothetical protein
LKELNLMLVRSSQTVASLKPTATPDIDYTPGDRLKERSADSFYHLGDLDLRLRSEDEKDWKDFSTAHERHPVSGHFLYHEQWFDGPTDPFHRAPGVISYDNEAGRQVRQDSRVWIAGLSDEAGAGSWLAGAVKQFGEPDREEVAKLESFVDGVLWGHLQESSGDHKYVVHKSLFYYQPDAMPANYYDPNLNWKSWTSWNIKGADDVGRSYNYPHVVAAYWSLYRLARNSQGLVTKHSWQWYLNRRK